MEPGGLSNNVIVQDAAGGPAYPVPLEEGGGIWAVLAGEGVGVGVGEYRQVGEEAVLCRPG